MMTNNNNKRAFTILELLVAMFLVALLTGPILNTFQVSERLSRRNYKSFASQNLAKEMMNEIAKKSFDDPYQSSTNNVNLKPGPTHEEYIPDATAPKIANGTDEATSVPRLFNETIVNRSKYYNDIDDYDGYNSDEVLLPTLANGKEYLIDGENPYANLRVKVSVKSGASGALPPQEVLKDGATLGPNPSALTMTPDGKYALVADANNKNVATINVDKGIEIDNGNDTISPWCWNETPNTAGIDRVNITEQIVTPNAEYKAKPRYQMGKPIKAITGPTGDRFYFLHDEGALDDYYISGISSVDMNKFNTPEVSFHKINDLSLISCDLLSNSVKSIVVGPVWSNSNIYAILDGIGIMNSGDNGEKWSAGMGIALNSFGTYTDTLSYKITCLASNPDKSNPSLYAGCIDGVWTNRSGWKKTLQTSFPVTSIVSSENGYVVAGLSDGNIYFSKQFGDKVSGISSFVSRNGPVSGKKVNVITIDGNFRVWVGNDDGLYYSSDIFDQSIANATWNSYWPAGVAKSPVNTIHIDKSKTFPAPFTNVLNRSGAGVPGIVCSPSISVNETGIHLFYLDDRDDGANGTTLGNPKLWYINSPDHGKTWNTEKKICSTPAGSSVWAHSHVIDRGGVIHATWHDNRDSGKWKLYYQRSEDGGKTWLSSDICSGNHNGTAVLDELYFKSGAEWQKYGSGKFRNIAASPSNTIYTICSDKTGKHFINYSNDGGKTWPAGNVYVITGQSGDIAESIDFIERTNNLMVITQLGTDRKGRKMYMVDPMSWTTQINNAFSLSSDAYSSIPAVIPDTRGLYYYYAKSIGNDHTTSTPIKYTIQSKMPFPFNAINENKIQFILPVDYYPHSVHDIMGSSISGEKVAVFHWYQDERNAGSPSVMAKLSDSSGNYFHPPLFIDTLWGNYDSLTTASYDGRTYFLKKNIGAGSASPASNFKLSGFPEEIIFAGTSNGIISFSGDVLNNGFDYFETGNSINSISGDGFGNILCATSNGLIIRDIDHPNVQIWGSGVTCDLVNFPPVFVSTPTSTFKWKNYFNGIDITSVFAEPGGIFWAGTRNKGIFLSRDHAQTWTNKEGNLSKITDIGFIGKGVADKINKLVIFSRRFNNKKAGVSDLIVNELTASIHNLTNNQIESTTTLAVDLIDSPFSTSSLSYDGSKFVTFDCNDKKLYIKKADEIYYNQVKPNSSVIDGSWGDSDIVHTGIHVKAGDKIEICADGHYSSGGSYLCFTYPAGYYFHWGGGDPLSNLKMKLAGSVYPCSQYCNVNVQYDSEIEYFISNITKVAINVGYCTVKTTVRHKPELLCPNEFNPISKIIAAPDNKTVYLICTSENSIYSISDINDTLSVVINKYSLNITDPINVIFSPKNLKGEYKVYIVCKSNIIDLYGNKIFSDVSAMNISDATVDDNGKIYFIDKNSRKLFKCVNAAEKIVYVTVKETDNDVAGSMPPFTLVRKFFDWQAASEVRRGYIPSRNYIKYEYVYTSKKYPAGITAGTTALWAPQKSGVYDTLNVYVVDNVLEVKGTLEIQAGTVVKFSTADKSNLNNFYGWSDGYSIGSSGNGNSGIKVVPGGKLIVAGGIKKSENVIFTSVDDQTVPPSVYNSSDVNFKSNEGLPNLQNRREWWQSSNYYQKCGALPGDWGATDWSNNFSGGICQADDSCSKIDNLTSRYGLFFTSSLYPAGKIPENYDTGSGICKWSKDNAYVINKTPQFTIGERTKLYIEQGAYIYYLLNSSIKAENLSNNLPHFSLISDGSIKHPVYYRNYIGNTFNAFLISGHGEIISIRNSIVNNSNLILLSGSNTIFTDSTLGYKYSTIGFSITADNYDSSKILDSNINVKYPGSINCQNGTSNLIKTDLITYYCNSGDGSLGVSLIKSNSGAYLKVDNCKFLVSQTGGGYPSVDCSKIRIEAAASITNNKFIAETHTTPVTNGTLNEIVIDGSPNNPAHAEIKNNKFDWFRNAIYIKGFDTSTVVLDNLISNNTFTNCNTILKTDISSSGSDFPESASNAAVDKDNNIYFTDTTKNRVYKYTPNGRLLLSFGGPGTGDGQFNSPAAIAVNDTGEIYVVDQGNKRVQKFDAAGNFILKFGQ